MSEHRGNDEDSPANDDAADWTLPTPLSIGLSVADDDVVGIQSILPTHSAYDGPDGAM